MVKSMRVTRSTNSCMVKVSTLGQMAEGTRANGLKANNTATVSSLGQMVKGKRAHGLKAKAKESS